LEGLLIDFGYEVIGKCIKGEDAVGLYQTHHPDILFVEIHIDGVVTGLEVVRQVQGIGKPMVICIGSDLKGSVLEQVKEVMPNGYLCKPFDEEQLKTTTNIALYTDLEEKKKSAELSKKSEMQQMNIQELSETNSHLVAATWRERDLKKQLKDSLEQLELNKAIIEQQNKRIVDSINYANRIQQAIIPKSVDVSVVLPNHFMIYRPKDVVSGDFPWMFKKDEFVYFGVVDCTGHGVPGAMLSMIGYLLLNGIADVEGEDKTPSQVLFELHHQIVETLKQNLEGNNASDGMGIALCRINTETNEVMYSGAHRPLCHLSEGNVIQYKGDRFPIGGVQYRSEYVFTDTKIQVKEGESIYFFSDGVPDQFGGDDKKKFGSKKNRGIIEQNEGKFMLEMKDTFDKHLDDWMVNDWMVNEWELDDVLMIGVKF
jgi:serine phosphatase RsbU (regulator of sigma subunit)